jgi:ABC-type multidrug transport system fused ATPase/permease subunit
MLPSFFQLLTRCYRLALPYGRIRLLAVLGLILFNGLLQLVGVTSIFPFFALAADPERIRNSKFGTAFLSFLPTMDNNHLLVVAGSFSITMLVIASVGSIASEVVRIRYAYGFCHWLRTRLFESYAARPYGFFLARNSADLSRRLGDVMTFIQSVLLPIGEIITRIVMVVLLVGTVFLVQPWVAMGAIVILGGFYLLVFLWMRPKTRVIASGLQLHNSGFSKSTAQFLHGIKTVLVHGKSRYFMGKAMDHSAKIGKYQSQIPIFSNGPRYLIEPIAFGGLVSIVIILALRGRAFSDILPNLSVIALAAYRLLPTLQLLYSQLVTVAANNYTLSQLEEEILELENETEGSVAVISPSDVGELSFSKEIRLEGVTFSYSSEAPPILSNFNLTIPKNASIGIAGASGSGKSTLVDLILGLHAAEEGAIMVDEVPITAGTMDSWRRMIGYVPQEIYLTDENLAENIAFGIRADQIDELALRQAAEGAQILEFIESLPEGFKTRVGERGVRLSGGQRQRVGLARALYHRPQILILDEATSALDLATEEAVMQTIHSLQGQMTMITIAHRLSTLEKCNQVIRLTQS